MIRTQNLCLQVGGHVLIEAFDWQVQPGECWCVIGRNGAGKSTLLRTLAGVREPDSGLVLLEEKPVLNWALLPLARARAYLPQSKSDAFGYSALDTVLAARHPYHAGNQWESDEDRRIAMVAMQTMEVGGLAKRDVRTLSGGERQRVAIAALLAQDAPLMLLDEPASALDLAHQVGTMAMLARLCREQGKTVVMTGHDLNLAHSVATHAVLLMGGGAWRAGPVEDVMTEELLSHCLGHRVEQLRHGTRIVYIAAQ